MPVETKTVNLKTDLAFWRAYCQNASRLVPLMDYHTRVIWERIKCRLYPFCLFTPLIETCSCKLCSLKCELCRKVEWACVHHTSYDDEAIPESNPRWASHYKLACNSCHKKDHIKKPWLNNRKGWKEVFSAMSMVRETQFDVHVPEFNCYVINRYGRLDIVRLGQ